jgi:hypothetical protein
MWSDVTTETVCWMRFNWAPMGICNRRSLLELSFGIMSRFGHEKMEVSRKDIESWQKTPWTTYWHWTGPYLESRDKLPNKTIWPKDDLVFLDLYITFKYVWTTVLIAIHPIRQCWSRCYPESGIKVISTWNWCCQQEETRHWFSSWVPTRIQFQGHPRLWKGQILMLSFFERSNQLKVH